MISTEGVLCNDRDILHTVFDNQNKDFTLDSEAKTSQTSYQPIWETNGVVVSGNPNLGRYYPKICSDNAGGAIITWRGDGGIQAQRINSDGDKLWGYSGVSICNHTSFQNYPEICADGVGGAIIVWYDDRSGNADIYAQRINSTGSTLWVPNGTAICTEIGSQILPKLCSDSMEGAIITWRDDRGMIGDYDIYIQRINSTGSTLWVPNGTMISTEIDTQENPELCNDGAGGAIITWEDTRGVGVDIYAQRINSTGSTLWVPNGTAICTKDGSQRDPKICTDGGGDAIITWEDSRATTYGIYAQCINSTGSTLWEPNGTALCYGGGSHHPQICTDGQGGAVVVWYGYDNGDNVYAQRITEMGWKKWGVNGTIISQNNGIVAGGFTLTNWLQIFGNASNGWFITWNAASIYAQHINFFGVPTFGLDALEICTRVITVPPLMLSPWEPQICGDGVEGAIVTWRFGLSNYEIKAQRIAKIDTISEGGGSGGGNDDSDKKTGGEEAIPGYNIIILIGGLCLISIVLIIKRRN